MLGGEALPRTSRLSGNTVSYTPLGMLVLMPMAVLMVVNVLMVVGVLMVVVMHVDMVVGVAGMGLVLGRLVDVAVEGHVVAFLLFPAHGDGHLGAGDAALHSGLGGEHHPRPVSYTHLRSPGALRRTCSS